MWTSLYNRFVNFLQELDTIWFVTIWMLLLVVMLVCILRFFKIYNGTQQKFEKVSLMILALVAFAVLLSITYIRS